MRKTLMERRKRDAEINEQFGRVPAPVNTESVDDIIRFLNNNVIGHVEEETALVPAGENIAEDFSVEAQKVALDTLVSPAPASKAPRLFRGSVPLMGEMPRFQAEHQIEEPRLDVLVEEPIQHSGEMALQAFNVAQDEFLGRLNAMVEERYGNVLREIIENNNDEREKNRLIAIYKSLSRYESLRDTDEFLHTLPINVLQERINHQFNTYVTWLKTRTNTYIQQYFQFATPKIREIILTLNQFPAAFFVDPDQADMLGNRSSTLNFKQITFFVCYIALLCILLILYFIAGLIKFINDVDTMFGILVEIATETQDIRELRNEYRTRACMTGLGLLEYTLRCINVNHILKLMLSKVGIIPTIAIMCICIYVFRSQSPIFNWICVVVFNVLRIIVDNTPTTTPAAGATKRAIILFIDTQIHGVNQVAYENSPSKVQNLVDTAVYVTNTTSVFLDEAKDFVNNTMTVVPLLCANLTEQVVNANFTDISIRTVNDTANVVRDNLHDITEQISGIIETSVTGASEAIVDISTRVLEQGLGGLFLGMSVINEYSLFWASLVIEEEEDNGAINREEVIPRLKEEVGEHNILLHDESSMWLSIFQETAEAGDNILHSKQVNGNHIPFISEKFSKISKIPIPANQITIDPRSFTTQTVVDDRFIKYDVGPDENDAYTVDHVKSGYVGDGRTSVTNDHYGPEDQMVPYKQEAKVILDKIRLFDEIDFNSIIIPLMKDRYGDDSTENMVSLEKVPFEPPSNNAMKDAIHYVGGIVLKIALPETSITELQTDLLNARNAINNIYVDSKIILKKTILTVHGTTEQFLSFNQKEMIDKLNARANAIKSATAEQVHTTLVHYNTVIKVSVVVVAGTAILYVAPAAVGLAATILPPLYTTSMAGLQLVGSMGYHGGRAIGHGGYVAVNNVFYPTARAAVYMLSRVLGSLIIGNTVRINPDTMAVITTNEVTNFIFGNGAMWLPLDQSIGPALQVVTENAALVAQTANEISGVVTPFVRHNVNELASLIASNPTTIGAFATLTAAATTSTIVGNAIIEAKRNPVSNTSHLRRREDIILLDTPQNSPRSSYVDDLETTDFMDPWWNGLSSTQKDELNIEYGKYIKRLSNGEKEALDFKEDYRQYLITNNKATKEAMDRDRLTAKYIIMKQIQNRINKEAEAETEAAMNDATKINRPAQPETKTNSEERSSLIGAVSNFFTTPKRGGSKKKRKGTAKKSTRRYKKKSGKKGKSSKRKGSNKKRRHTRR